MSSLPAKIMDGIIIYDMKFSEDAIYNFLTEINPEIGKMDLLRIVHCSYHSLSKDFGFSEINDIIADVERGTSVFVAFLKHGINIDEL